MQMGTHTGRTPVDSPVDDATYNLLQTLTSKLEALDAYQVYAADGGADAQLFEEMAKTDYEQAEKLLDVLKDKLARA
jgi:hypothetical protein